MNKSHLILGACIALSTTGCGGGGGSSPSQNTGGNSSPSPAPVVADCGVEGQKAFAIEVANDWYLWYDEMATVNAADYSNATDLLLALTAPLAVDGRDPGFSFMTTIAQDEADITTGAFVGFGFRYTTTDDGSFFIADALEGGPAAEGGFARGVEVLAIDVGNGFETIDELDQRGAGQSELFGGNVDGLERSFRIRKGDQVTDVTLAKRELDTPPLVDAPRLIDRPSGNPVGYMHLRGFTESAIQPLAETVSEFAAQGVTDLVVDLRYNGGGLLNVAQELLDLLGGQLADGEVSIFLSHNDKQAAENAQALFAAREDGMTPLRIAFITTQGTASASEMVINSLAPHVEVVLVGEDTLGKAVGQGAFDQVGCDNRLRLVIIEVLNGESQGGYYRGLVDTGRFTLCPAEDDVTRGFGDPGEDSLDVALGWLNEGVCGVRSAASGTARVLTRSSKSQQKIRSWYPENPNQPDRRSPLWQ